jgi:hypothetical protein
MTTIINPSVSIKCNKNLFISWATMASQGFYSVKSIQQIHLYHKRSVTLPRRWCEGKPWRTAHRHKQTLCRGSELAVWRMCVSSRVYIHNVGPAVTWNTHKIFNHLQNHQNICLIFLIHLHCWEKRTSRNKHIELMLNVMSLSPNVYLQNY